MTSYTITRVTESHVTVSMGPRVIALTWGTLRDASRQDDALLARIYGDILADARHRARAMMTQRWETASACGPLDATSEATLDRLIALDVADGVPERAARASARLITLDPDQAAEERRRLGHYTHPSLLPRAWRASS